MPPSQEADGAVPRPTLRLASDTVCALRCPVCRAELNQEPAQFVCSGCQQAFPILNGVPVLLNEANSVFRLADYQASSPLTDKPKRRRALRLRMLIPRPDLNLEAEANYSRFARTLIQEVQQPVVLIIGGRILGRGLQPVVQNAAIRLVETDVNFGPRTQLITDGHDLPFADATFDGVIIQAVLEHVCDPYRVVSEIHRVLKPDGLLYAEIPFIQQVHLRAWDFTRFTDLGQRRLFRNFSEIDRGACCGSGMALAWSWQYFLLSFTSAPRLRTLLRVFARLTSFWLKYLDRFTIDSKGTLDAASSYYFLGRRSNQTVSDRELLQMFRGEWD